MRTLKIVLLTSLAVVLMSTTAAASALRIELDQADPHVGDSVTFTISGAPAKSSVNLQCGDRVAFGEGIIYDVTQPGNTAFDLPVSGTCIAWLLKKGTPVVGTLFWVTP